MRCFGIDQKPHELQQRTEDFHAHIVMREGFDDTEIKSHKRWLSNQDVVMPRMWHPHDQPDLGHEWKNSGLPLHDAGAAHRQHLDGRLGVMQWIGHLQYA